MIQTGLSEKVGVIIQGLSMLVSAFIVAFAKGWKLTLVTATTLPAAVIAVGITIALDARLEAKILDIYAKAGGLAEEALSSIRVVAAFGAQNKLLRKYDAYLEVAKTYGVKKGPILGTQYSAEFFMMYCAYALAFWYGIRLLLRGEIDSGGTVTTYVLRVMAPCLVVLSILQNPLLCRHRDLFTHHDRPLPGRSHESSCRGKGCS